MGNRSSCCRRSKSNCGYNNCCCNPAYYPSQSLSGYNAANMLPLINSGVPNNFCQVMPCNQSNACTNCGTSLKCKKCCKKSKKCAKKQKCVNKHTCALNYHIIHLPQQQYCGNGQDFGGIGSVYSVYGAAGNNYLNVPATNFSF